MESIEGEWRSPSSEESEKVLQLLESHGITLLKERSPKFPTAKYQCSICDFHIKDTFHAQKHLDKHRKQNGIHLEELSQKTLSFLPLNQNDFPSSSAYYEALEVFLVGLYEENRLTDKELRSSYAQEILSDILQSGIQDITLQYNGSSLSGFALRSVSAMDFSLQVKEVSLVKKTLEELIHHLSSSSRGEEETYKDLKKDFSLRIPLISFTYSKDSIPCTISLVNENPHKTALLLQEYWKMDHRVRVLGVLVRKWAHSLQITNHKDTVIPSHAFIILLLHYLIHEAVVPCIWEWGTDEEELLDIQEKDVQEKLSSWKTKSTKSLGELWIGFFKYYAFQFNIRDHIVTICHSSVVTKSEKQWKYKRLAVAEPYNPNNNLFRVIHNTIVFEYIQKCFHFSCLYFGIPRTREGPLFKFLLKNEESVEARLGRLSLNEGFSKSDLLTLEEARNRLDSLNSKEFFFEWNVDELSNNSKMPLVCSVCTNEGHTQKSCPDESLPVVHELPPLPPENLSCLDKFFTQNMEFRKVTNHELSERNTILKDIMGFIRRFGYPNAVLTVYGSSENGFGFRNSDLDMCLTFEDHKSTDFDAAKVITDIAKIIQRMAGVVKVRPITSAKVPIIKFFHLHTGLEGDISLYNCLASENTRLLRTYSNIDIRLQTLGYNLKQFIKACDFGDASRGSLSSYTCIIMAIYYLQNCQPPILPVLQELYDPNLKTIPTKLFEGYDVWFNSNPSDINDWKNKHPKNTSTSAELLIGFFYFFGQQFDSENLVVSIRTSQTIKKLDKMWNTDCLAVEDPFELNRNLGGRLTRKMHLFIKKCFIKGYQRFSTPYDKKYRFVDYDKYFFNATNLGVGKAPTDRGCHICGGIWHVVRECPRKVFMKRRKTIPKKPHEERREIIRASEEGAPRNGANRSLEEPIPASPRSNGVAVNNQGLRPKKKTNSHYEYIVTNSQLRVSPKESSLSPFPIYNGGGESNLLLRHAQKQQGSYTKEPPDPNTFEKAPPHRFIHGAIRLEDLERTFEQPTSSPMQGGLALQRPPPGFLPGNQVPPAALHQQQSHFSPALGPPKHFHPQQFPQFGFSDGQNFDMSQKEALERLLGTTPPLPFPPPCPPGVPLNHSNIQGPVAEANNLQGHPRPSLPGGGGGYMLPYGFPPQLIREGDLLSALKPLIPNDSNSKRH